MAYRLLGFDGAAAHDDRPVWLNEEARAVAAEAVPEVREKLRCCDAAQIFGASAGDCSIPGLTWHGDPSAASVDDSPEDIVTELEHLLRPAHLNLDAQRWLSESTVPPALGM